MTSPLANNLIDISVEEYLSGERESDVKHEYVGGKVFEVAGVCRNHSLLSGNISALLWNQLQSHSYYPLMGSMLLKTSDNHYCYPDVLVVCDNDPSDDEYVRESPVLIVEVLSRSTRRRDKTEKRDEYLALPSLQEYILIEQDVAEVEVQRRSNDWHSEYFLLGSGNYF